MPTWLAGRGSIQRPAEPPRRTHACRLTEFPPNQATLAAAGAVPDMVALLRSSSGGGSSPSILEIAATLLSRMIEEDDAEAAKAEVVAHGGPAALGQCLGHSNERVQAAAASECVLGPSACS